MLKTRISPLEKVNMDRYVVVVAFHLQSERSSKDYKGNSSNCFISNVDVNKSLTRVSLLLSNYSSYWLTEVSSFTKPCCMILGYFVHIVNLYVSKEETSSLILLMCYKLVWLILALSVLGLQTAKLVYDKLKEISASKCMTDGSLMPGNVTNVIRYVHVTTSVPVTSNDCWKTFKSLLQFQEDFSIAVARTFSC